MAATGSFKIESLPLLLSIIGKSSDFSRVNLKIGPNHLILSYYLSMSDSRELHDNLMPALQAIHQEIQNWSDLLGTLPFDDMAIENAPDKIAEKLQKGYIMIQLGSQAEEVLLVNVTNETMWQRTNNDTENEFSVIGSKSGFV